MILVTAFEPFGGATVNASWEAARLWAASDASVRLSVLPVVRGEAERVALAALAALPAPPALWLALGEAGPEPVVRLEKVALNWDDFRLPDNAGNTVRDTPIRPDGPAAYFATLPVAALERELAGNTPLPVRVSLSAGAFLCNHLAYVALDAGTACPFCFVHVPAWRPEHGEAAREALVTTLRALADAALRCV